MDKPSASPHGVILLLAVATLLNYVDRSNLSTAAPLLQVELSLSNTQMGVLLSAFFWVYAPAQILAGWLVHRYSIRVVLAAGVVLWSAATGLTGLVSGFASILVLRLLLGLGESVTFPSWQLIVATHTLEHERGRANGIIGSGQGIGPMLGTLFGGLAMARFGWRFMFVGLGILTVLWLWPWFVVTRNGLAGPVEAHNTASVSYGAILRTREFWGAALAHFSNNYAFYFIITWLPTYLVRAGGLSIPQMAGVVAAIYAVYSATTVAAGLVADRWIARGGSPTRVRKAFLLTSAIGTAAAIGGSAIADPRIIVWLLGASGVFFGLATSNGFAVTATLAGPRAAGRWAGAQNVAGQLAGVVSPLATGLIVDQTRSFAAAFATAGAVALIAALGWGLVIRRVATVQWADDVVTAPVVAAMVASR